MSDFYSIADGRSTAFYLGAEGTCVAVDHAIDEWHKRVIRERQEAHALRNRPEEIPE